jgi:hypothetical protein
MCAQFGDVGAPSCSVSAWSAWTACSPLTIPSSTTGAQLLFKSRTRTMVFGFSQTCPDLQEIAQCGTYLCWRTLPYQPGPHFPPVSKNHHLCSSDLCAAGYELDVNPWPVTLAPDIYTTMNVRLQMPPADGNVITVIVDSSAGADFFLVSTCKLTFTAANWNVYQPVYIIPVFASSIAITSPVCFCTSDLMLMITPLPSENHLFLLPAVDFPAACRPLTLCSLRKATAPCTMGTTLACCSAALEVKVVFCRRRSTTLSYPRTFSLCGRRSP